MVSTLFPLLKMSVNTAPDLRVINQALEGEGAGWGGECSAAQGLPQLQSLLTSWGLILWHWQQHLSGEQLESLNSAVGLS